MKYLLLLAAALVAAGGSLRASADDPPVLSGPYTAVPIRVIDGDTVEVRVRLWLHQELTTRVRLRGINAAEPHGPCPAERAAAEAARRHLIALLGAGPVTLTEIGPDPFAGRVVAALAAADGRDAGTALRAAGLAVPWPGPTPWCAPP